MRLSFKYRLYPNQNQARELAVMLETHRRLYNACLEQRKAVYEAEKRSVRAYEQSRWFTAQRKINPYFAKLNHTSAGATIQRLDRAFEAFFRRMKAGQKPGYPRFKAKDRFGSFNYPHYGDGIRLVGNRLRVQHVGMVRAKVHRPAQGVVKVAALTIDGGKWYLVLSCDIGPIYPPKNVNPHVGIDMGIESFLTTSDGVHEPNPRFLNFGLAEIRRLNRALARKKNCSRNRQKAKGRLTACHAKIKNLRSDFHHKLANKLVRKHGLIAMESLTITNMVKNRRISRAISDAGWAAFQGILRYKAERAGAKVIEVDPRWTSQMCSACGALVEKKLSDRWHKCDCGYSAHRDVNAARVILSRALARIGPVEPNRVEVRPHVPRIRVAVDHKEV